MVIIGGPRAHPAPLAASFVAAEGVPASDIASQLDHADGGALTLGV